MRGRHLNFEQWWALANTCLTAPNDATRQVIKEIAQLAWNTGSESGYILGWQRALITEENANDF
jgi:hypothetical protein